MIIYSCSKGMTGGIKEMDNENMSNAEFKTILEMITMIIEGSKDKDEALEKIKNLTILKEEN